MYTKQNTNNCGKCVLYKNKPLTVFTDMRLLRQPQARIINKQSQISLRRLAAEKRATFPEENVAL